MTPTLPERLKALDVERVHQRLEHANGILCRNGMCVVCDARIQLGIVRNALPELLAALENEAALLGMLALAKCPNGCEPGQGWYVTQNYRTGEPEQTQCQWCDEQRIRLDAARPTACATEGDGNG